MLKGLKYSLVERKISNSKRNSSSQFKMPISSAAIVLGSTNIKALPVLLKLKHEFNLKDSNFQLLLIRKSEEHFSEFNGLTFVEDDLNILGNFNNKELLDFTQNHIDLLITFAEENSLLLRLLTATSNASLKVGNNTENEDILDVVIKSGDEVELFTSELIKFLKQFKNKNDE